MELQGQKKDGYDFSDFYTLQHRYIPDYQQQYGNGFDQSFGWFFSTWGPSFDRDGVSGWGNQSAIDNQGTLEHPYSTTSVAKTREAFPELQGARYEWRPYNSVEEFFRPGSGTNTNVNISGGSQDGSTTFNVNLGYLDETNFTPGNGLNRFNLSVGGRSQLSNKFTVQATANYSRTDYTSPPIASSRGNGTDGLSVYGNVMFTPISVDLMGLPFENPIDGSSVYYRNGNDIINPRWTAKNVTNTQLTNRVNWTASLNYEINDNLSLTWRSGLDFYNERNVNSSNKGGVEFTQAIFGFLNTYDNNNSIWDHFFAVNGNYDLSEKLGMTFTVGATSRQDHFDQQGAASTGQIVFGVKRHFNFENQTPIQFSQKRNIVGILGQATLDYDTSYS